MATISSDAAAFDYTPPETSGGNVAQTMAIFTPASPHGGLLMVSEGGNYLTQAGATVLFDDTLSDMHTFVVNAYNAGWIIVSYGSTGWNINTISPGADAAEGLWREPDDPTYSSDFTVSWNERDTVFARQRVELIRTTTGFAVPIATMGHVGVSSGAIQGAYCYLGPDRAFAGETGQLALPTNFSFGLTLLPVPWWPAMVQADWLGFHWPTGGSGTVKAPTMADADPDQVKGASIIHWMNQAVAANPMHQFPKQYVVSEEAHEAFALTLNPAGEPGLSNALPATTVHPSWGLQIMGERLFRHVGLAGMRTLARLVLETPAKVEAVANLSSADRSLDYSLASIFTDGGSDGILDRLSWLATQAPNFAGLSFPPGSDQDIPSAAANSPISVRGVAGTVSHVSGALASNS